MTHRNVEYIAHRERTRGQKPVRPPAGLHRKLALSTLLALTSVAGANRPDGNDADAIAAAHLLWGEGLQVDVNDATHMVKVSYPASGGLDDARVRHLIQQYLLTTVDDQAGSYSFNADLQIQMVDYKAARQAGGNVFALIEPVMKRQICIRIAEQQVRDQTKKKELIDYCYWTAARFARHTLHGFHGQPVDTTTFGLVNVAKGLPYATKFSTDQGFTLLVPGVPSENNVQARRAQQNLLGYMPEENRYYGESQKMHRDNEVWTKKKEAEVIALDKKQGGAGGKVVFAKRFFGRWDPVVGVAKLDSCNPVYWKAYGPPNVARGAVFIWEMSVDDSVCQTDFIQNHHIAAGGPFFTGTTNNCSGKLVAAGPHTLKVQLFATTDAKTGRVNVALNGNHATLSNEVRSQKTRVVAKGTIACTSPEGWRITGG